MAFQNGRYYDEYNPANYYNTPGRQGVWDPTGSYAKSLQPGNLNMPGLPTGGTPTTTPAAQNTPSFITNTPQDVTRSFSSPMTGTTDTGYTSLPTAQPDLASITDLVNKLNRDAQATANANRIPNASGLETASSNNIASLLAGNVPEDVKRNLIQTAAERGISMGSPGGDNANASLLQALGLTSLGLQDKGQLDLTAALARNPGAPIFDPSQLLLTPAQKLAADLANKKLQLDWLKALPQNTLPIRRTAGGGGGGSSATDQWLRNALNGGNNDWFGNAFRQATGGYGVNPAPRNAPPTYTDPYGYSNPEQPGLGEYVDAGIGTYSPYDYLNPEQPGPGEYVDTGNIGPTNLNDYWGSGYDPFSQYYDPGMATDYQNPEWGD